jgi:hypothetical protein
VTFTIRSGQQRALLKTSIISLGQLDENGCDTTIHAGVMTLFDRNDIELAKVRCRARCLYVVKLEICALVCLA